MNTIFALLMMPALLLAEKAEIKMLIDQDKLEAAKTTLKIKSGETPEVRVCFFDTAETALDGKRVILRVRLEEKPNDQGVKEVDAVVKLRGTEKAPKGFEGKKPEADWVGPDAVQDVKPSFSIKTEGLSEEMMRKVLAGTAGVKEMLSEEQQKFAAACLEVTEAAFPWAKLRRYGVIEVWKSKREVGPLKKVTVEFWRLTAEAKAPLELLEISIKTKEGDAQPVAEVAKEFYEEAEKAGLGKAAGTSKTQMVLGYYKPGK